MAYRLKRRVEVSIIGKREEVTSIDFALRLDGEQQVTYFTVGHLAELPHGKGDGKYSEHYHGNFETDNGDGTTHCEPALLHIYADEPRRGLLNIYEVVDEI